MGNSHFTSWFCHHEFDSRRAGLPPEPAMPKARETPSLFFLFSPYPCRPRVATWMG